MGEARRREGRRLQRARPSRNNACMTTAALLYAVGAALQGWLAVMLGISGRVLHGADERWPRLLAAAFAFNTLRSALFAFGFGLVPMADSPRLLTGTLSLLAVGLITAALMNYVGLDARVRRRAWWVAGPVLLVLEISVPFHWITRGTASAIIILFTLGWAAMFLHAMRREPRNGHGFVVLATLTFPLVVIALRLGWLPFEMIGLSEILPLPAIGIAVLTTGLVRANQRAQREGEQTARALAAREHAEAALRLVNESLEQRVAQRTEHLQETIDGLESFNRSVSHDLRGPLGGIAGVTRMARDKLAEGRLDEADAMLAAIGRQADASVAMVAALLALARAGNAQPQRTCVDATALASEVVATLEAAGRTSAATVVVQPLPEADADRELLRQVFANLVGNACKFAAGRAAARVEVGHERTPQGQAYFVRDNGIGFAPAEASRLFRPFERLNGQRYEGFGVGLSIVQRIVDHHGGRVWAEGAPGAGATFWFTLGRPEPRPAT